MTAKNTYRVYRNDKCACGATLFEGDNFCRSCGMSLASLICPKCGREITYSDKYCGNCGTSKKTALNSAKKRGVENNGKI